MRTSLSGEWSPRRKAARPRPFIIGAHSPTTIIESVDLEKTLLRKVGEAIHRFKMIRDGDRVAVALSGGKETVMVSVVRMNKT